MKKIALGCDHTAVAFKNTLKAHLQQQGYLITDCGTNNSTSVHYPVFGYRAAVQVSSGQCTQAVVICGTGIGIANAANKIKGIRVALVNSVCAAIYAVQQLNANVLALGARTLGADLACMIVDEFLKARYCSTNSISQAVVQTANNLITHDQVEKNLFQ